MDGWMEEAHNYYYHYQFLIRFNYLPCFPGYRIALEKQRPHTSRTALRIWSYRRREMQSHHHQLSDTDRQTQCGVEETKRNKARKEGGSDGYKGGSCGPFL